MLKSIALVGGLLIATNALAQTSLQSMHTRVPAPPATVAAAPAWLASAEITTLRKQLKDQRTFIEKLMNDAAATNNAAGLGNAGGIDFQRAQRDPAYAQQIQAKIATMNQAEQMALAMEMSKATQQAALTDVKKMANDPEAVKIAADHYADYQMKQASGGITAQSTAINDIRQKVSTRSMEIAEKASKALKCSDGEGSCSAADPAADKATLRAAYEQIIGESNQALVEIAAQVAAARKARAADIAAVQKDLGPTQYGAAAKSSTNRQLLAAYHNAALGEVEQLFILSEDTATWAANRVKDRKINFVAID